MDVDGAGGRPSADSILLLVRGLGSARDARNRVVINSNATRSTTRHKAFNHTWAIQFGLHDQDAQITRHYVFSGHSDTPDPGHE
ncbi:hypothetical protein Agabi119p4_7839 [Agaricus bisporus var. burnettii]|uniref:Uncharacterized protein n=1 Tax=Agaricus bisporus var. burnettii TaxID=192524 RepID=A0A8H7C802_AGABI|nr:hypothetical protein Agabi119p4_7839 [Agaricus bisporus var. burnettii]